MDRAVPLAPRATLVTPSRARPPAWAAVRFVRSSAAAAHAYSVPRIAKPTATTRIPGPGSTSMAKPLSRNAAPTTVTAIRLELRPMKRMISTGRGFIAQLYEGPMGTAGFVPINPRAIRTGSLQVRGIAGVWRAGPRITDKDGGRERDACEPTIPLGAEHRGAAEMALLRRALLALGLAGLVATVLRIRGTGGTPPQEGGWRELSGPDLQ